jgi:hypothetical protein
MVGLFIRYSVVRDIVVVFSALVADLASFGTSVLSYIRVISGCEPRMRPLPVRIVNRRRGNGRISLRNDGVGQVHRIGTTAR